MEAIPVMKSKESDGRDTRKALYHKLVEDQRVVEKYFRGEYTLQQLHAKGISLFKPLRSSHR